MIFQRGSKKLKELLTGGHWLGRSVTTDRMYDIEQHLREMSVAIARMQDDVEKVKDAQGFDRTDFRELS